MKDASDRLRELRIKKGFENASDAAQAFGWNENTYKSHENGIRGIKPAVARKYASALGSTAAYILTGSGPETTVPVTITSAAVLGVVSAGIWREDDRIVEGALRQVPIVPREDIPADAQYALLVDGPSVNTRIADGAFAICAVYGRVPGGARHGQLVHVVRERAGLHEHTIKELRYTPEGKMLYPCSTDPRYQEPVTLASGDADEIVRIHGVVIGSYQPL